MIRVVIEFIHSIRDGGAETIVKDYALLLEKSRFKVIVITLYPSDFASANYRQLMDNGVKVFSLINHYPFIKPIILQKVWNKLFFIRFFSRKLLKICQEESASCIHVHSDLLKFLSPISADLKGIRLLYTCHSLPSRYLNSFDKKDELKAAKKLCSTNGLTIIALHSEMKNELSVLLKSDNVIVLPNGVNFERFLSSPETKVSIREGLGIPSDAFVVGHVGRFSPMKNHVFLIDVFTHIIRYNNNAFLLLVGDGPTREEIDRKILSCGIENKVLILSHRSDIPQILRAMDVFIFPSLFEGLPVSMIEAQLMSIRCLMSDAITRDCVFSKNVIPISLDESPSVWAQIAVDNSIEGDTSNDIHMYDIRNVLEKLEGLYL